MSMIERLRVPHADAAELTKLQLEYDRLTKCAAAALALDGGIPSDEFINTERAAINVRRLIHEMLGKA